MNYELRNMYRERFVAYFKVLFRHLPGVTEENYQIFRQASPCPGRDSNQAPPEYKSGAFSLHQAAQY
jgi:hypothetical protein